MAVEPTPVVTREMVYEWLTEFKQSRKRNLRKFLEDKLAGQTNLLVDTRGRDGRDAMTPLIDLILDDVKSYEVSNG